MQPRAHPIFPGLSRLFLDPLSILYKAAAYADWWRKRRRQRPFPGLFIISCDGLAFGGSGKTPLVMAVGKALESRGARFAVVSRGYRSRAEKRGIRVEITHGSEEVGDEPLLLKSRFPDRDVFVGADRLGSIAAAAARGNRIILLDDGFQSSHVRKDLSILLINPADPYYFLRHFRFQSRRADRVLTYRQGAEGQPAPGTYHFHISGFLNASGRPVEMGGAAVVAFSALGDNERFAADMRRWRLAAFRPFPDHHAYRAEDLRSLESLRRDAGAAWLVCTEKDFLKLRGLLAPDLPLLYARNEIQLPQDVIEQVMQHAAEKGFL